MEMTAAPTDNGTVSISAIAEVKELAGRVGGMDQLAAIVNAMR